MKLIDLKQFPVDTLKYKKIEKRVPEVRNRGRVTDYTGKDFNDNHIVGFVGIVRKSLKITAGLWLCRCKCGKYHLLESGSIRKVKSCRKCSLKRLGWEWTQYL